MKSSLVSEAILKMFRLIIMGNWSNKANKKLSILLDNRVERTSRIYRSPFLNILNMLLTFIG